MRMGLSPLLAVFFLVAASAVGASASLEIVLVHTNDMHARIMEISQGAGACVDLSRCYGGFARVKAEVDRIKAKNTNVIFLNAGDNFQGTPLYSVHKWKVIAKFIDMMGIDAMSLGNHEFDDGVSGLVPYLKKVSTPTVSSNIDTRLEESFIGTNLHPWINLTVGNTLIGVVGYLTPDTKFLAKTGKVVLNDEVESVRKSAQEARNAGAKIVFAVGHSGYDVDKIIAQEVEEIDVVVGGHTNTFLYTGTPPDIEVPADSYPHFEVQKSGKKVPVVQAFAYTKYLGYLELKFDDSFDLISAKGNPILLDSSYPKDEALEAELPPWKKAADEQVKQPLGKSVVDLDGSCRMRECNTGNFITDSWVDYAVTANLPPEGWTSAPIAITNGGSIRTPISRNETQEGEVNVGMFLTTMPFINELFILTMNGSVLLEALEEAVWNYDPTGIVLKGGFLQVSGLRVVYDVGAKQGKRVVSAEARCGTCSIPKYQSIDPKRIYSVVTSSFLADGGDGITAFKKASRVNLGESGSQAVMNYFIKLGTIHPGEEGRLIVLNKLGEPEKNVSPSSGNSLFSKIPILFHTMLASILRSRN